MHRFLEKWGVNKLFLLHSNVDEKSANLYKTRQKNGTSNLKKVHVSHLFLHRTLWTCTLKTIYGINGHTAARQLVAETKTAKRLAQCHHRCLITREHPIINSVSRPPVLFTWDWKVFALGFPDWLRRPSAASSPRLRFASFLFFFFVFLLPPSSSFSFHYEQRVRLIPHRQFVKVTDSVCGSNLLKQHLCDPQKKKKNRSLQPMSPCMRTTC